MCIDARERASDQTKQSIRMNIYNLQFNVNTVCRSNIKKTQCANVYVQACVCVCLCSGGIIELVVY